MDLDLAVDLAPQQASVAIAALTSLGFTPRLPVDAAGFADAAVRRSWVEEKGMTVFSLWDPHDPTRAADLFVAEPIAFEQLYEGSDLVEIGATRARIASVEDLIALKQISGQPVDLDDIEALRTILEQGKGDS